MTASTITVQKADEKWEIARDPAAKNDATLKVGERVTIHYRMTATKIEANPGKAGAAKTTETSETLRPFLRRRRRNKSTRRPF